MVLRMAESIAGHDKGQIYVLLGEEDRDYYLVNGANRLVDQPKRKRKTHVQLIKNVPAVLAAQAEATERWTDESVRNIIRQYIKIRRKPQEDK